MHDAQKNEKTKQKLLTGSWYAVHVLTGEEDRAVREIQQADADEVLQEVFVPRCAFGVYDAGKGCWNSDERVMFPGYVVAVSRDAEAMERVLRVVRVYASALGDGEGAVRMADDEVAFLNDMTKQGRRVIAMSEGTIVEGGQVIVTDGPLVGREAQIVKVLHRKKRAVIRVRFCGRDKEVEVGLRVVRARGEKRVKSESMALASA